MAAFVGAGSEAPMPSGCLPWQSRDSSSPWSWGGAGGGGWRGQQDGTEIPVLGVEPEPCAGSKSRKPGQDDQEAKRDARGTNPKMAFILRAVQEEALWCQSNLQNSSG